MARRIHTSAQIIHKLREVAVLLAQGQSVQQAARQIEVTESRPIIVGERSMVVFGCIRRNDLKR